MSEPTHIDHGETATDLGPEAAAQVDHAWIVTVVFHGDERRIGERRVLLPGEEILLGRGVELFGPTTFQDSKVSRRHAALRLENGEVTLADLGSRNGTFVNGLRCDMTRLAAGDVVTVGGVLLLVHRGPALRRAVSHPELVGVSASLGSVLHQVQIVGPQSTTVLVRGETGVGKELVARAIHRASGRPGDIVAVNCSAMSDGVLQSELFGHVKGAFSGAAASREGLVAMAEDGTLFFDEIGDASPALQASLLRLLEQRERRAVGSDQVQSTNARFVAATHVDLQQAVEDGRFRADLLNRIDRWCIDIPPLRERREDVIPIALSAARQLAGRQDITLARSLAHALLSYDWPGNVRELQSVMEIAILASEPPHLGLCPAIEARIEVQAVPSSLAPPPAVHSVAGRPRRGPGRGRPSDDKLRLLFDQAGGNLRALSKRLGVGRTTLYRWFDRAGIDVKELRASTDDDE